MQFEDIKSIGVVGAGQMGRGIAQVCATAGYQVLLADVDEPLLAAAVSKIREIGRASCREKCRSRWSPYH